MSAFRADVAVIGAGPVGLFALFEAGMAGLTSAVVETLPAVGGQCAALYPQKPIYDIPGFPEIRAGELAERLREQAARFRPEYFLARQAVSLERQEGFFRIGTDKGDVIEAKSVILAAGGGAFAPNRPPLEGIEAYEGSCVLYSVPDKEAFRGKRVVIAGGGDSAADWAVELADIAASVRIVHRRPDFRCAEDSKRKLAALAASGAVTIEAPYRLHRLEGEGGTLRAVVVRTLKDDGEKRLEADFLLPFFGLAMHLGHLEQWGLAMERKHIAVDPATMATNVPGVYAVGDVVSYPGKLKLILTGFAEAALAAHSVRAYLFPEKTFHFEYSTSSVIFEKDAACS
jgi:thioredoxin reductase (NADPH)